MTKKSFLGINQQKNFIVHIHYESMVLNAVHNVCGTFGEHPVQAGSWGHRGTRAHLQQIRTCMLNFIRG